MSELLGQGSENNLPLIWEREPANTSEVFGAAFRKTRTLDDAYGRSYNEENAYFAEIAESYFDGDTSLFPKLTGRLGRQARKQKYIDFLVEQAKTDPEKFGALPKNLNEFDQVITKRLLDQLNDDQAILDAASPGSFLPEIAGTLASAGTDEAAVATGFVGLGIGAATRTGLLGTMAIEATLGAGGEALTLPRQREMAARLGTEQPNAALQIGVAAGVSAVFPLAGEVVKAAIKGPARLRRIVDEKSRSDAEGDVAKPSTEEEFVQAEDQARTALETDDPSEYPVARDETVVENATPKGEVRGVVGGDDYYSRLAQIESGGRVNVKARTSSAKGLFQFTKGTWARTIRKYRSDLAAGKTDNQLYAMIDNNPALQREMAEAFTNENARILRSTGIDPTDGDLYLAHFAGAGAAKKVLSANSSTPINRLLSRQAITANSGINFRGKSFASFTAGDLRSWADSKMRGPGVRSHIVDPDDGPSGYRRDFRASELQVDAKTYQFRSGGDEFGVTDALNGVNQWDPFAAGALVVHERLDGSFFVANGHQRTGLARRLEANGHDPIHLHSMVMREADGHTIDDAMFRASLVNIAEGTANSIDAAKIIRLRPEEAARIAGGARGRDAFGLAKLSDDAFGMAVNDVIPAEQAAIVGRVTGKGADQVALINTLNKVKPKTLQEAEYIARDALRMGTRKANDVQDSLFGAEFDILDTLVVDRAKVLKNAVKRLAKDKTVFGSLGRNADAISAEGNRLNASANATRARQAAEVQSIIEKLATRAGPVSDALDKAAKIRRESGNDAAVKEFIDDARRAISEGGEGLEGLSAVTRGSPDANPERFTSPSPAGREFSDPESNGTRSAVADEGLREVNRLLDEDPAFGNFPFSKSGGPTVKSVVDDINADADFIDQLELCPNGSSR